MADLSYQTINRLWQNTRQSTWSSLYDGLHTILDQDVISPEDYDDISYAINKLESLGVDFPTSAHELLDRLNFYL
jgi:hypothetical protein